MLDFGFYNMDCMKALKDFPDGYFDLAICDPPYGGGTDADAANVFEGGISGRFGQRFERYLSKDPRGHCGGGHMKEYGYGHWDIAPDKAYFQELFRVSKKSIIWGGTTSRYHRHGAFLYGKRQIYPKSSLWLCASTHGQTFVITRRFSSIPAHERLKVANFTRQKSR